MKALFVDTFYWSALLNARDDWHPQVRQFSQSLTDVSLVTTEEVLTELLNFFSSFRYVTRLGAVRLVDDIIANPNIQLISQTHETFLAGFSLYRQRLAQEYSLTDCISLS